MLQLTSTAARYVSEVREQQGLPADAPLRITANPSDGRIEQLHLGFVNAPGESDQVSEVEGVPYCVAPDLAEATESVVLDVDQSADGPRFFLADQS